jgi:biofilm PGA synthesis N-glycosyltransferase PgaC
MGKGHHRSAKHRLDKRRSVASAINATAEETVKAAVFLDPSGRRWRTLRLVGIPLLVLLTLLVGYTAFQMTSPPATSAPASDRQVTSAQTGPRPPVVGEGPMVRVLELDRREEAVIGKDPFRGTELAVLDSEEVTEAGAAAFVIQRYGYAPTTERTISLTFDDGPDAQNTPQLLDVLSAAQAPATFFVTGSNAANYSDIMSRMTREGHVVANHTLTHVDITKSSPWRAKMELILTDHALRALTDYATPSFRLPYSSDDPESMQKTVDGILRAQQWGYLVSSHDFDTLDWEHTARPGDGAIPLPPLDGRNITILMHDAGGNRAKTISYVRDELIPAAKAAGYVFQTMPQIQPALQETSGPIDPTIWDHATLAFVKLLYVWPKAILRSLFLFALASVAVVGLFNVTLALWRRARRPRYPDHLPLRPVTVLIAAYNEETVIARTLQTLLGSTYPVLEILVVDDGSTDDTSGEVQRMAEQDSRIRLIRQVNGGKWAALNNGLTHAYGEIIVTLDADTIFTPETVANLVRQFTLNNADDLGAVAGIVRVGNRELNVLTRWQALEYLTQIGVERSAYAQLNAVPIIPGACAAWRKEAILGAGGYSDATLAEDCDLTLSLHQQGWRVSQDDEALSFTEAPGHVDALLAQRIRWTFGTLQAVFKHRNMLFRPRYGWLGMVVLPYSVISILIPIVFLPFIAVMGVITVQTQGWGQLLTYFAGFMLVHAVIVVVAILLMREQWKHLLLIPIYRIVYEPLRAYLLYTSCYLAIRGVRLGWNKLHRTGAMDTINLRGLEGSRDLIAANNAVRDGDTRR